MTETLKVGIVGANWGLVGHLPVWRQMEGVEVVAICTRHEETARRAADAYNIPKAYWDHRTMLADDAIDIADIGTKPATRQDIVLDALAAGKHVLTCNPFATDMTLARKQYDLQQRNDVIGAVEAQFQWQPQFLRARRLIEEGYLGKVHGIRLDCHFGLMKSGGAVYPALTRPIGYPSSDSYNWLGEAGSGASALRNLGGHCLFALIALFGPVEAVLGTTRTALAEWNFPDGSCLKPETSDTAFVMLRFESGAIAQLSIGWSVPHARGFGLEAWGSHGRIRMRDPGGFPGTTNTRLIGATLDGEEYQQPPLWPNEEDELDVSSELAAHDNYGTAGPAGIAMHGLFDNMVNAIRTGGDVKPGFFEALQVQAIFDAVDRSSASSRWEPLQLAPPQS